MPPNYFCIQKVSIANNAEQIEKGGHIETPLDQYIAMFNKNFVQYYTQDNWKHIKPTQLPFMMNEQAVMDYNHWYYVSWNKTTKNVQFTAKKIQNDLTMYNSAPLLDSKVFYYGFVNLHNIDKYAAKGDD